MNKLLELAKEKGIVLISDYKIEYKGTKIDTAIGKTESWTITKRNLSLFEVGDKEC